MSGPPTVIYSAASTQQAYLLRGLLEDEGIAARVVNDAVQIAGGELPLGWTAAARVVVPAEDAAKARQFAEQFDRQAAGGIAELESDADAAMGSDSTDHATWPSCPVCEMRRTTQCSACGELGTDFPVADFQPRSMKDQVLLICRGCDNAMQPAWYRYCAGCGHDFGSGIEPPPSMTGPDWSLASIIVLIVLLLVGAGFGTYFWWLFG
jgi:hypothetical protein